MIPFNKPFITGKETHYMYKAVFDGHISGNGQFTKLCHAFFEEKWGFSKCLLTTSCTDALEMAALLIETKPGDEIIVPSFTFVSTALAFVRQGAKIVFVDSRQDHPGIDEGKIEKLITENTKAIVPVHYAGIACDMDTIIKIANKYDLLVVEDAAQAIDSYYKGKQLGTFGNLSVFSFHETKNIQSGEGGLLAINDEKFSRRAEIIWEKGTNRAEFFRGEVNKYGWVDIGSSFLPADYLAGFLYAQLEELDSIQMRRIEIWERYNSNLSRLERKGFFKLPIIPSYATNNAHMFYIVCKDFDERNGLINYLKNNGVHAVFHYLSLHKSDYYRDKYLGGELIESDRYTNCLLRLPFYYELSNSSIDKITSLIAGYYER